VSDTTKAAQWLAAGKQKNHVQDMETAELPEVPGVDSP